MELREYLSIRRAYNLVRQEQSTDYRLTFAEFAILCRLQVAGGSLKTSDIAEYQGSLRPTMTHRTKHLSKLGLIERLKGDIDKRNVVCKVTEEGSACAARLCRETCGKISVGQALARISPERMCKYVDAMGSVNCMAGELIVLGLWLGGEDGRSITELVDDLGLLQPTVSMSVASLEDNGIVERMDGQPGRTGRVLLTEKGMAIADEINAQISGLIIRRRLRTKQ